MDTFILKISLNDDLRRISLPKNQTFQKFRQVIERLFNLESGEPFILKYQDDDKDLISITSDMELMEAIRFSESAQQKVLRLFMYRTENSSLTVSQIDRQIRTDTILEEEQRKLEERQDKERKEREEKMRQTEELLKKQRAMEEQQKVEERKIKEEQERKEKEAEEKAKEEKEKIEKEMIRLQEQYARQLAEEEARKLEIEKRKKKETIQPIIREYLARNGDRVKLDISRNATEKFGLHHGTRVESLSGPGTVVGVDVKRGHLWFKIDADSGISFWDDIKDSETLYCKGITLLDAEKDRNIPYAKKILHEAPVGKTRLTEAELEEQMISRAIQESLLDEEQSRIQSNYLQNLQ